MALHFFSKLSLTDNMFLLFAFLLFNVELQFVIKFASMLSALETYIGSVKKPTDFSPAQVPIKGPPPVLGNQSAVQDLA